MELSVKDNNIHINAASDDPRLAELPGYGWHPRSREWKFILHPGIVALAAEVLESDLTVPDEMIDQAVEWESKLDGRVGPTIDDPVFENNRYIISHEESDNRWALLIPSGELIPGGSRFIKHDATLRIFRRIFQPQSESEIQNLNLHSGITIDEPQVLEDEVGSLKGPNNGLGPVETHPEPQNSLDYDVGLHVDGSGTLEDCRTVDEWINKLITMFQEAAVGLFLHEADLGALSDTIVESDETNKTKHTLARLLAGEINRQGPEDIRIKIIAEWTSQLRWDERLALLMALWDTSLDYSVEDAIDDRVLIFDAISGLIGSNNFRSMNEIMDILHICDSHKAYSNALDAYTNGRVVDDHRSLLANVIHDFLLEILKWASERTDEQFINLAFDTYCRFLSDDSVPEHLEAIVNVCSGIGQRRSLRVKGALLAAHAIRSLNTGAGGIENAIRHLVANNGTIPPDYEGSDLICKEAGLLAGTDPQLRNLLGRCEDTAEESEPARSEVKGNLLVIGGNPAIVRKGKEMLTELFPLVEIEWLDVKRAERPTRLRGLINKGKRKVLIYTWVMSHSIENNARRAADNAGIEWDRVRSPGLSGILQAADRILGV
ncbi:hypothetical protein M1N48_00700 [Dehalococcoidia bacterium]|nr:hypothetical protein [Dehalococcoidia bacterium]